MALVCAGASRPLQAEILRRWRSSDTPGGVSRQAPGVAVAPFRRWMRTGPQPARRVPAAVTLLLHLVDLRGLAGANAQLEELGRRRQVQAELGLGVDREARAASGQRQEMATEPSIC